VGNVLLGKRMIKKLEGSRDDMLQEKIKNDIVANLRKKGIDLSKIHIDLNTSNMNVTVSINK
jgi:hypothetical protein